MAPVLKGVTESARRHVQALSYIPGEGTLLAGGGVECRLGEVLAEGGEGRIHAIQGRDDLVAKIYKEVDFSRGPKLRLMGEQASRGLRKICAWPVSPLLDAHGETVGFLMESLVGWEPLHNAYQIRSRLRLFPYQNYAFLVRIAQNLAVAVHQLHEAGIVIGDLNESNVFVDPAAMVKLVDADSFQLGRYPCRVGKAELLPPELQGRSLEDVVRTADHDRFALAALIFQTLVFGRHPFAGQVPHPIELTLEDCIESGRYPYSVRREVGLNPPPHLGLDWLPDGIRSLFEDAFDPAALTRPTARDWYSALRDFEGSLRNCDDNPSHLYWSGAGVCPWCELEDAWKIALFRPELGDPYLELELSEILASIEAVPPPPGVRDPALRFDYTALTPANVGAFPVIVRRLAKDWGWFLFCSLQIALWFGPPGKGILAIAAAAAAVVLAALGMIYARSEVAVRRAARNLDDLSRLWSKEADGALFEDQVGSYRELAASLRRSKERFESARQDFIEDLHRPELLRYLAKYSVLVADAGPLGSERLGYLHDHGIPTAADLTIENLRAMPRILPVIEIERLAEWRDSLERTFWRSRNYRPTVQQERRLLIELRRENDRIRKRLEEGPEALALLAARLRARQAELTSLAEREVATLRVHGPKLLAFEGKVRR